MPAFPSHGLLAKKTITCRWEIIQQNGMSWLMRKPFEDEHIVFATYFEEFD